MGTGLSLNSFSMVYKNEIEKGKKVLRLASAQGSPDTLEHFLKKDPSALNKPENSGISLLKAAMDDSNVDNVRFLMQKVDVTTTDEQGQTVLHLAVKNIFDSVELLSILLENKEIKTLISAKDKKGNTPLKNACYREAEAVKILIENGADRWEKDEIGCSVLEYAVSYDPSKMLEALLVKGPSEFDINEKNFLGYTLLMSAVSADRIDNAKILLDHEADPMVCDQWGNTVLHIAAGGKLSTLEALLDLDLKGLSINARSKLGRTPLMEAIESKEIDNVKILLDHGADPMACDQWGNTVLHIAARGKLSTLEALLGLDLKGLSIDVRSQLGRTPLMEAIESKEIDNVKCLLNHGASRKVSDRRGNGVLYYAASSTPKILKFLLRYEDIREQLNRKPLLGGHIPLVHANEECADILKEITHISLFSQDWIEIAIFQPGIFCELVGKKIRGIVEVFNYKNKPLQSDQMVLQSNPVYGDPIDAQPQGLLNLEKKNK